MVTLVTEKNQTPVLWKELLAWSVVVLYMCAQMYITLNFFDEKLSAIKLLFSVAALLGLMPIVYQTSFGKDAFLFAQSAWLEIRQVTWPERDEAVRLTLVVVVAMSIVSIFLWGVDIAVATLLRSVILG